MEQRQLKGGYDARRTLFSVLATVVLFIILVLVNVIFSQANIRWDLTENHIFSLSPGTKHILANLKEPITIKLFVSKSNRNFPTDLKHYARRVRDFLEEYRYASNNKVQLEEYDPKVDSDEEEWAQTYGIQPMQTGTGDRIYCGLVFLCQDREEKIPLLDPNREELLEYDLTRIIHQLESPRKKVVGVLSSLPVFGSSGPLMPGQPADANPWFFITELEKSYEVRRIQLSADRIDPAIDLLLIIHPKQLSEKMQYAVDQYILAGKNSIIFVDPFCLSDNSRQQQVGFRQPSSSSLDRLFKQWGIVANTSKVLVDFDHLTRVRTQTGAVEDSPVMISARADVLNQQDIITAKLESMLFPLAGSVEKTEKSEYDFEPLIRSGKNAGLIDSFQVNFGTAALRRNFVRGDHQYNIAVRVRGKFKTAFPGGPPSAEESTDASSKEQPETSHLAEAAKPSTVIVVADADMLADRFFVHRGRFLGFPIARVFNDNLSFVANACELLTGSDDLIALRSRSKSDRPFTTVLALQSRAQERWLAKEKELAKRAEETNKKLRELQQRKNSSQKLILSPEQEAEIDRFRQEKRKIDRELKEVRKNLRADIESLGTRLKWLNILAMPIVVCFAGILFAIYRQRRMRRP
ncbi:MAG: Gldg family protein [Deltaproteobacteria bacterium]|nr:Gldg family protein [Deltaproteobacteria bacterium]MBW2072605.1 Gldg family protein [Deltaproteobacteria bacterium]